MRNEFMYYVIVWNLRINVCVYGSVYFGYGGGFIFLDDLSCIGYESNLFDYNYWYIGYNDCSYSEDVGVSCGKIW